MPSTASVRTRAARSGKERSSGCVVTCPWHGWQFDVRTGQHRTYSLGAPRFAAESKAVDSGRAP